MPQDHFDTEELEAVVGEAETLLDVCKALRLERTAARQLLREHGLGGHLKIPKTSPRSSEIETKRLADLR